LIVNPYDSEQVARSLALAIDMPVPQQEWRMRRLRRTVTRWDAHRWSAQIISDVAVAQPVGKSPPRAVGRVASTVH
jgi:trehalose-6-phosphate synthase